MSNVENQNARKPDAPKGQTATLIYHAEDGDPSKVQWAGITFKANVPVEVALKHSISVPIRKETVLADGTVQSRNIETRVSIVELARKNHAFSVDGIRAERKVASARQPTDPDTYRGYAIGWISGSTSAKAMDARWDAEAGLRERCGCEASDIAWLRPFYEAKREECA